MKPEILRDLPIEQYHDASNGFVSHSRLQDFVDHGPAFYEGRYVTGEIAREEKEHFTFGNGFEVLYQRGGDAFEAGYAVQPAHLKGNTTAGKAWIAGNQHKARLKHEDYECMLKMASALNQCTRGRELIESAEQQVTLRAELFGLSFQARPDWVMFDDMRPAITDLKTTRDIKGFTRDRGPAIWKLHYHSQLALMRRLLAECGYPNAACYLFVAEKTGLNAACVKVPEDVLRAGDAWLAEEAPKLAECIRTGIFPCAVPGIVELEAPAWMQRQAEATVPA